MRIFGNKGEWSELYVLIRLLAEGKIYSAKEDLQKNSDCYLPILKIFRDEGDSHKIEYIQNSNKNDIELYLNGTFIKRISTEELSKVAEYFYNAIVHGKGKGSFEIDNAEVIMANLKCNKIKAKSTDKTDILMEIHDPFTNFNQICGFSIKSDLGNSPTLFNASKSTNFKFEVLGLSEAEVNVVNEINGKSKIKTELKGFLS